jgi:hypothetical protein
LSCPDIVKFLASFLPRRDLDPDELIRQNAQPENDELLFIDSEQAGHQEVAGLLAKGKFLVKSVNCR